MRYASRSCLLPKLAAPNRQTLLLRRQYEGARTRQVCSQAWWQLRKGTDASRPRTDEESASASNGSQRPELSDSSSVVDYSADASEFVLQNLTSLDQVKAEEWNDCVRSSSEENPFLLYEFLNALEQSGAANRFTGWLPYHIVLRRKSDNKMVGCCPLYLKNHSYGEYVFDHQWAQISAFCGKRYYPKLQSCVPFTPVPGNRLLVNADEHDDATLIRKALAVSLKATADALNVSSAHLTFNLEDEHKLLEEEGYLGRIGLQYHWHNHDYATFDEFLMDLRQSKRKNIRQERKYVQRQGVEFERLRGDDIQSHHWDTLYNFYQHTCMRKWGEAYLNREFFHMIGESMKDKVLLVFAKTSTDDYVAGAWNCIGSHALFGRNWGKRQRYDCKHLHFEVCYYQAIDAAIEMGLSRVEAGAQGEHKIQRGYLPTPTYSSHYIRSEPTRSQIKRITDHERIHILDAIEYMQISYSPFKWQS